MTSIPFSSPAIIALNSRGTVASNGVIFRSVPSVKDNLTVGQLNRRATLKIIEKLPTRASEGDGRSSAMTQMGRSSDGDDLKMLSQYRSING